MALMVEEARGITHVDEVLKDAKFTILHFRAPWCDASKQMDVVFEQLCSDTAPRARFLRVEAEEHPDISEKYSVTAVPFFVFFKDGKPVGNLEGANPAELSRKVTELVGPAAFAGNGNGKAANDDAKPTKPVLSEAAKAKLQNILNSNAVMLFMKGTAEKPRCGFSRKVVDALEDIDVKFGTFDILSDEEVRQGLKIYSDWPTYPQLYYKGELVGGCDVVSEMHESGELKEALGGEGEEENESMEKRLKKLINSAETMLFMKGNPEEPKCGFSKKVVDCLKGEGIEFKSFDILSDEEVRQGLKSYSNWPTFPQLYHKGELLGGCDIVLEMKKNGELGDLKSQ